MTGLGGQPAPRPFVPADAVETLVAKVVALYGDAEAALIRRMAASIAKGIDTDQWQQRQLLELMRYRREAEALLVKLQQQAATVGEDVVLGAAARGSAHGLAEVGAALAVPLGDMKHVQVDTEAVVALARDLTGKLGNTGTPILRSVDDMYRRVIADVTARALLGAQTRREVAQAALDEFARQGITGYWDRKGRRWEIEAYTEMATRSSLMNAAIEGHAARLEANGFDLVVISDAPQECKLCLVPGTLVEGPAPTWRTRTEYRGDVIRIVTASGKDLTGTPDHTVLTGSGWRSLKDLRPGDQVVSNTRPQWNAGVMPDDIQVPTLIEEAGEAFAPLLLSSPTRRDLDQGVAYREVCAVFPNGDLLPEQHSALSEPFGDLDFIGAIRSAAPPAGVGGGGAAFEWLATHGFMGGFEHRSPLVSGGIGPALSHRGASHGGSLLMAQIGHVLHDGVMLGAGGDPSSAEVVGHYPSADAEGGAELLRGFPGDVSLDEIVSLSVSQFSGHVWDLTTEPNWFLANGIVTHNCRPWEGKILSLSGNISDAIGDQRVTVAGTLDEARAAGLYHPGCRHSHTAWHRNVRSFGETADPEGAAARQKLRYLERQVRASKRQKLAALDDDAARKAQRRVAEYQAKIREHVATTSAKRQPQREQLGAR